GIYLAKSFAPQNLKMLRLIKGLGHTVVAWDEEGLIHYPPEVYWGRRITQAILPYLDHMIAWGDDYVELLESHHKPFPVPIHNLGNPRGDFLRSELHPYYHEYVQSLRNQYGRFILVNTNFPSVNSFDPELQLAKVDSAGQNLTLAKGSQGMPEGFAKGRFDYKHRLFKAFQEMVDNLSARFPDTTILVRPHPSESFAPWLDLAKASSNIIVKNEGNVLPWILACSVLVHNGCTTGVEGFALRKPVLAYQPFPYEEFESNLPNELSRLCSSMDDLVHTIKTMTQPGGSAPTENPQTKLGRYLTAMDGPLASERIVNFLLTLARPYQIRKQSPILYGLSFIKSLLRHRKKRKHEKKGTLRYSPAFQQQRFPELHLADLQKQITRFQEIFPGPNLISATPFGKNVFTLSATQKS
ncbi:MAG: hypothetical protein R3B74_08970, partial [Nitrospirales bacterium]|nr:hypothetical protein [Nitrospirales bacterium]